MITLRTHSSTTLRIQIPHSLYVPDLPCNLISPQWLIAALQKQQKKSSFHIFPQGCLLLIDSHVIPLQYHPTSNLPVFRLEPHQPYTAMLSGISTTTDSLDTFDLLYGFNSRIETLLALPAFRQTPEQHANLTNKQKLLYDWHVRLGHMNFAAIQSMARKDIGIPLALASCQPPLCQECQYGKAKRRSIKDPRPIGERPLLPGEMCCVDQMVVGCAGLPYTM